LASRTRRTRRPPASEMLAEISSIGCSVLTKWASVLDAKYG
jgi:hypothetical protein